MIYNFDDLSFKILSIERYTHKAGKFNVKARPFAALAFREKGEGNFEIQEKKLVSKAGTVLFVPENEPYSVEYTAGTSLVIHFLDCNYTLTEYIEPDNAGAVYVLFEELVQEWQKGCTVNRAKALVYNLLAEIEKNPPAAENDREFVICESYIREHFTDPELDMETVCAQAFISRSGLRRKFYRHYNMSPKQYVLKLRTEKAIRLLTSGELSVKEIAALCGFKDEKYFSRVIKETYGMPPSAVSKRFKM